VATPRERRKAWSPTPVKTAERPWTGIERTKSGPRDWPDAHSERPSWGVYLP
jgi:hypothetical protein